MSQFGFAFHLLVQSHKEGSFNTRASRKKVLNLVAVQLLENGFKLKAPQGLKPKHIDYLISRWQEEKLSASTIKNRVAVLRWTADKIGKKNIIARTNDEYNIERRQHRPEGKAKELDTAKLALVRDPHVQLSLRLQREFGLRREESIKFQPSYAIREGYIQIKASWTKGGRARTIPITRESQQQLLKLALEVVKGGSLIPADKNYIQQLKLYERETARAGLTQNHGLRHQYARERYQELTGWPCPANGGPRRKELTAEQLAVDVAARLLVSSDLGHSRFSITYTYLGS